MHCESSSEMPGYRCEKAVTGYWRGASSSEMCPMVPVSTCWCEHCLTRGHGSVRCPHKVSERGLGSYLSGDYLQYPGCGCGPICGQGWPDPSLSVRQHSPLTLNIATSSCLETRFTSWMHYLIKLKQSTSLIQSTSFIMAIVIISNVLYKTLLHSSTNQMT